MKRLITTLLIASSLLPTSAQQTFNLYPKVVGEDKVMVQNGVKTVTDVVNPSIEVYLPSPDKANGCAVILCPGGALRVLSWTSDVEEMAEFLNANGIAAIGLKYHLNTEPMSQGIKMPPMVDVTGFENFKDADCNPIHYAHGDSILELASSDAKAAMKFVREHSKEWNIEKVGYIGFSAGGGVAISATMDALEDSERPDFLITNFGPSLKPVKVPTPVPPLLIMSRADHPNVAAGLVSLFMEWKKAGGNAELHLYGEGRGPYTLMPHNASTTTEAWSDQCLLWLKSKGFCK